MGIYEEVGARRVINASFPVTLLGGSRLTKEMLEAFVEANETYVDFWDFMQKAGRFIANLTGAEAAFPTCGAFSALALSATACIAGKDPEKIRRLPDATGMKNEIIIQKCLRAPIYDRSMTVSGGKYVFVGNETGCTPKEMESAINEKTAAIHYLVSDRAPEKALPLEEVIKIGKKHGVPIIIDAAGQTWPVDGLRKFTRMGADLVCYSSKYFGGPNAAGFVEGRKDLVEAVSIHTFLGQESQGRVMDAYSVGRGYKMDRQTVACMLYALKRWVTMDHEKERIEPARRRARYIVNELQGLTKVKVNPYPETFTSGHILGVQMNFADPKTSEEVVRKLREGDPAIWIRGSFVNTLFLGEGEEKTVAKRIKEILQ